MALSKQVKIGSQTYVVKKVHYEDAQTGRTLLHKNIIEVSRDICKQQQQATALHEVLHGICYVYGLSRTLSSEQEETIVTALEEGLLQFIRDNPGFIKYLMEKDG